MGKPAIRAKLRARQEELAAWREENDRKNSSYLRSPTVR